jgi:hypothetical protein
MKTLRKDQQALIVTDPIIAIGNLEMWLDRDGIDAAATTQGDNVNSWTCKITGNVFDGKVGQPTLDITGGKREVQFAGTSVLFIPESEFPEIDFTPQSDEATILVKLGNDAGDSGTVFAKTYSGNTNMQFQLNAQITADGIIAGNFGTVSSIDHYSQYDRTGALEPNKVFGVVIGNTANGSGYYDDLQYFYEDDGLQDPNTVQHPNGELVGTSVNDAPISVGARMNGDDTSIGFQFEGSIAHVLYFSKKLTLSEITTVVNNLD